VAFSDDLVTTILVASSAFFVVLSLGLLIRYREVSQRINASTDLGKDLWIALDQRLDKQDERILDMMGKFEVIQSRFERAEPDFAKVKRPKQQPEFEIDRPMISKVPRDMLVQTTSHITLDETELAVINLLNNKSRSSVEIKDLISKSREHAARLMKKLFDLGLVARDNSKRPFVYQLTESGRNYVSPS